MQLLLRTHLHVCWIPKKTVIVCVDNLMNAIDQKSNVTKQEQMLDFLTFNTSRYGRILIKRCWQRNQIAS